MAEIQDQVESVEERSDRAYQESMETVKGNSKETSKEGKEGASGSQEPAGLASAYTGQGWSEKDKLVQTEERGLPVVKKPLQSSELAPTRSRKPVTATKSADAQSIVKKLTLQAAMVMWVDSVQVPEILESGSADKEARDVMISYQKAIEQAKNEAIQSIQKL